ncbi:hypothetical protein SMICM304S_03679 [Streptomyces microflavus]
MAATTGASATSKAPSAEAYQLAGKVKPRISVRALVDASRIIVEYAWKRMKLKTTDPRKSTTYGRSLPRSSAVTRGLRNITTKYVIGAMTEMTVSTSTNRSMVSQPASARAVARTATATAPPMISRTARRMAAGASANSAPSLRPTR